MSYLNYRKLKNILFYISLYVAALIILLPLFLILQFIVAKGASSLNLDVFTQMPKPAGESGGGMKHAIMGTFYMLTVGSLIAIPTGMFCGFYLSEYATSKLAKILSFGIDLLTGVPSIIIGLFAYILLVIPLGSFSALAGGFALSIIILPIVTRTTEEILKLVPTHIREAGLALGIPRWKVIIFLVAGGNLNAIITGIMLALSRAAGETAPLLFTAFSNMALSYDPLTPMASLPVQIYNYAISPYESWQQQAWSGAFILIMLVLSINLGARIIVNRNKIISKIRK